MNDHARAPRRDADHYVLEARAAHIYLDAVGALKDVARQQLNIERAREVLAVLDGALLDTAPQDPLRVHLQPLRDRLCERLNAFP